MITLLLLFLAGNAEARLNVLTSIVDLRVIVAEVGGAHVNAESIARGTQDPHYLEAKPSFMLKANKADLVVAIGLDLEVGWLPSIIQGARNPKVLPGGKGYLEVGPKLSPIDVPGGKLTRAEGDVHPGGNPHVTLDPIRAGEIALLVAERLGVLDPAHKTEYMMNAGRFAERLKEKTKDWRARIEKSGVKRVVSYHKTFSYFFDRFGLENPVILEPKPGIPPTSGHIIRVIELVKREKIPLILVENVFDPTVTKKIRAEAPFVRVAVEPISVEGEPGVKNLDDLYERLVSAVEGK